MNLTRRDFGKYAGGAALVLASSAAINLEGCTSASVFTDIENWVPVGLQAFQGIVSLLEGVGLINPVISPLIAAIIAGFDDVLADVKAYQAIVPPPAGMLAKIEEVFSLIVSNFQSMLSQLQISGGTLVNVIIGLAQVIISTITGLVGKLPASSSVRITSGSFKVGRDTVSYVPMARTRRQFKKDYNKIAAAGGHPEIELKLTLWEHF
jgi:hypothetical protein